MLEAVILAGGKSRRMGRDKLALPQSGSTVLEETIRRFERYFDRVYISVDRADRYPEINAVHIVDIYKECGPMGGLHAALSKAEGEGIFLAAADLPFSEPKIALKMIELCGDNDICITVDKTGRYEPLFGYYKVCTLNTVSELLKSNNFKMAEIYKRHKILTVYPENMDGLWSERAFENMNYPEDYERLLSK